MLFVAAQAVCPVGVAHVLGLAAVDECYAVHSGFVVLSDLLWGLCVHDLLRFRVLGLDCQASINVNLHLCRVAFDYAINVVVD